MITLSRRRRQDGQLPAGEHPYPDVTSPMTALQTTSVLPSFTPAETAPLPVLAGGPIPAGITVRPVIGDGMGPLPSWEPPPPPVPGNSPELYSGPGWTRRLGGPRAWDRARSAWLADIDRGFGQNVADFHAGLRHSRERIMEGARQVCETLGAPGLTAMLLDRVSDLTREARDNARREQHGGAR